MERDRFLHGIQRMDDWNNHLYLLWLSLNATQYGDVLEMGCGDGSTRQLHEYCEEHERMLYSFDTELEWLDRFRMEHRPFHEYHHVINHWEIAQNICPNPSVILIDHAPGERRWIDIKNYSDKITGIMVIHDTQPPPTAADYNYEKIWGLFKYIVDLEVDKHESGDNRTWASAVSNHFDVTKWAGMNLGREDYRLVAR